MFPCIQAQEHAGTMSPSIINSFSVVLKVHILFSSKYKNPAWGWGASSALKPGEEKNTHTRSLKMLLSFPEWEGDSEEVFHIERSIHCLFFCPFACVL